MFESRSRHEYMSVFFCAVMSCESRDLVIGQSPVQTVLPNCLNRTENSRRQFWTGTVLSRYCDMNSSFYYYTIISDLWAPFFYLRSLFYRSIFFLLLLLSRYRMHLCRMAIFNFIIHICFTQIMPSFSATSLSLLAQHTLVNVVSYCALRRPHCCSRYFLLHVRQRNWRL